MVITNQNKHMRRLTGVKWTLISRLSLGTWWPPWWGSIKAETERVMTSLITQTSGIAIHLHPARAKPAQALWMQRPLASSQRNTAWFLFSQCTAGRIWQGATVSFTLPWVSQDPGLLSPWKTTCQSANEESDKCRDSQELALSEKGSQHTDFS